MTLTYIAEYICRKDENSDEARNTIKLLWEIIMRNTAVFQKPLIEED